MGASNVAQVFTYWSKSELTHRELVALLFMANTAKDTDSPPVYFGGWELIAHAVGLDGDAMAARTDPDADPESKRQAKSVEEQVRRIMQKLIKQGALVSGGDARRGTANDYALALGTHVTFKPAGRKKDEHGRRRMTWEQVPRTVSPTEKEGQASTEKVGQSPPNRRGIIHRLGGQCPTEKEGPRNKEDVLEEYIEEPSSSVSQVTSAHASEETAATAAEIIDDDGFTQFWASYPRKVGKQTAKTKYRAALKRASAETINAAAQQLANDPNLPEQRYIPHPATWLGRDGWEDEPLPNRRDMTASERRMRAGYELMQGADQQFNAPNPFLTPPEPAPTAIETPAPRPIEPPTGQLEDLGEQTTATRPLTEDEETEYAKASAVMQRLPNYGQTLIDQARQENPELSIRQLVINAAKKHLGR